MLFSVWKTPFLCPFLCEKTYSSEWDFDDFLILPLTKAKKILIEIETLQPIEWRHLHFKKGFNTLHTCTVIWARYYLHDNYRNIITRKINSTTCVRNLCTSICKIFFCCNLFIDHATIVHMCSVDDVHDLKCARFLCAWKIRGFSFQITWRIYPVTALSFFLQQHHQLLARISARHLFAAGQRAS